MALVSTFELLVKPIAPVGTGPNVVRRTIVQGYFQPICPIVRLGGIFPYNK